MIDPSTMMHLWRYTTSVTFGSLPVIDDSFRQSVCLERRS
ncbi:MAG: hypothetical protein QOF70_3799 [Acetobacteraceae bacterium]|jgi:hypothetical protein|nr:hypothetical protein [Acetobacteraceae bacterium]